MFLFLTYFLISSGTFSTPKLSKQTISFSLKNKEQSNSYQDLHIHQDLLRMPCPLFFLGRQFFEKTPLNLGLF